MNNIKVVPSQFVPTGRGNMVLRAEGFAISFNPDTSQILGEIGAGDTEAETAIVGDKDFFILNGDFTTEYAELAPKGLIACLEFFISKPELVSSWSASVETAQRLIKGELLA